MGKCAVKECLSKSETHTKAQGITFYRVPEDPVRRLKWVDVIRLLRKETVWIPSKSTRICSKHFKDRDKIGPKSSGGRGRLSDEAIPVLADKSDVEENLEAAGAENMDADGINDLKSDEEMQEITESPQEQKMRKTIHRLKLVCTQRQKKIKNVLQKNKRLETRNIKLQEVVETLKKKNLLLTRIIYHQSKSFINIA